MDILFVLAGGFFGLAILLISLFVVSSTFSHEFTGANARALIEQASKKREEEEAELLKKLDLPKTKALSAPSGNPVTPGLTFDEPCIVLIIE